MYKTIIAVICFTLMLSGCGVIDKIIGDKDGSASEDGETIEAVAVKPAPEAELDISQTLYTLDDPDIKLSPLAWIYESEAGVQLTSPLDFRATTNTSTSFQIEHNSPDVALIVRVDQTEYKPVDFERLAVDESLFIKNVVPKNANRQESNFVANEDHLYLTYITTHGTAKRYHSIFLVNTGFEIFKIITERSDTYELEIPLTVGRVKPQASADYKFIVDEVVRAQVRDMAFSVPRGDESQWAIREGDDWLKIIDGSSDLTVTVYEGKTLTDIPAPEVFQTALGQGEWETSVAEEGYDYTFTSGERIFRVVCILSGDNDLYVFSSHNLPYYRYLNTIRTADAPDIVTLVKLGEVLDREVTGTTVLEYRETIGELSIDTTASEWPITQVFDSWEIKIKEDDWVRVGASAADMTTTTVKNSDPTITDVKLNGDHFIASTTDGLVMYFKQHVIDDKRWDVVAIGTEGFAMAKSVRQSDGYKFLQGYSEDHISFGTATFTAPVGTIEVEDSVPTTFTLPDGKGRLVFELVTKENEEISIPETAEYVGPYAFINAETVMFETKIKDDYRIVAYGELAKEVLYTLRIGR